MLASSRKRFERKSALMHALQNFDSIPIDDLARQTGVGSSTLRRKLRPLVKDNLVRVSVGKVFLA